MPWSNLCFFFFQVMLHTPGDVRPLRHLKIELLYSFSLISNGILRQTSQNISTSVRQMQRHLKMNRCPLQMLWMIFYWMPEWINLSFMLVYQANTFQNSCLKDKQMLPFFFFFFREAKKDATKTLKCMAEDLGFCVYSQVVL